MRRRSVRSVASNAHPTTRVGRRGMVKAVEDRPLVEFIGEQVRQSADRGTPLGERRFDFRPRRWRCHLLVVRPFVGVRGKGNHVHQCLTGDGEVKNMRPGSYVHVLIAGFIYRDGFVHGNERAIRDFVGVAGVRGWVPYA